MNDTINYYDLLGISKNATADEIKLAYRSQIKKWHPDINKDPNASKISSELNEAKDCLLDEDKRREYDAYLENKKSAQYENLEKKQSSRTKSSSANGDTTTTNTYQETTKMYTKWEYFKLYLKYYDVSKTRKVFATIFVILETIICFTLNAINYIIAYTIIYLYELIQMIIQICALVIFAFVAKDCIEKNITEVGLVLRILAGCIVFISAYILPLYVLLFINIFPRLISKLNMKLFKMSIGYKN